MKILTLIPEADTYGLAILVIYGLSSSALAVRLHSRWLSNLGLEFLHTYSIVLAFTGMWGLLIFEAQSIFSSSPIRWVLSSAIGLALGPIAVWSDRAINRFLFRRRKPENAYTNNKSQQLIYNRQRLIQVKAKRGGGLNQIAKRGTVSSRDTNGSDLEKMTLWSLLTVAVLEEIIFRGWLITVCFSLPGKIWVAIGIFITLIVFCLSHIQYGWLQVIGKLPLGVVALVPVLITDSVSGAITAHLFFNAKMFRASELYREHLQGVLSQDRQSGWRR